MHIQIAVTNDPNHTVLFKLNPQKMELTNKRIDTTTLPDENISLLLFNQDLEQTGLESFAEKESKFYPIVPIQSLGISPELFANLEAENMKEILNKGVSRWVLNNNLQLIEQMHQTGKYLKDLWIKDRNTFFEELWFLIKTNLATTDLNIIFHDLKEPNEKQAEKGEKPKLCFSYVKGKKQPNLFEGKVTEEALMKEYENEFGTFFNITEFSEEKGELIACAKIGLSPILIMAKIAHFNQLQQSILVGLFSGLQDEE